MPFIPHTKDETEKMLESVGVDTMEALFQEIPEKLKVKDLKLPDGMNELELTKHMQSQAKNVSRLQCFAGAGAYEHHIPAAVWSLTSRGEFLTAYTPYQAEASQGTLQLVWEYQSMISSLMALDASNASLYDGSTALCEAILMAIRAKKGQKVHRILLPESLHPSYRKVVNNIVAQTGVELISVPYEVQSGTMSVATVEKIREQHGDVTALVIAQPNYFGQLEDVHDLTDWAKMHNAYVIGCVNPMLSAFLSPPGEWGQSGVDIACGEGQPLGVWMQGGGPYYGFLCCRKPFIRQLPGRIVGKTTDKHGEVGFTLTLQAREQHIRRAKATSNICTNQGLLVTASTIYMSLMGEQGLKDVSRCSIENTQYLLKKCLAIDSVEKVFDGHHGHEVLLRLPVPVKDLLAKMCDKGYLPGVSLSEDYPELDNTLLICVTETKSKAEIDQFVSTLDDVLSTMNKG